MKVVYDYSKSIEKSVFNNQIYAVIYFGILV